ncbi:MAG: DEAD/DEAH box helicase [Rhodospirillaceae bacterium]|nr:DEAD/DEAH box helicase [Rhodospirillaceae bacterium]
MMTRPPTVTSLPASNSSGASQAFSLLDERIQRWIWEQGWDELREVQETAIGAILGQSQDLIISAATAGGKTEAAFFPILTTLLQNPAANKLVIYISPLKALINDQWDRLDRLCATLDIAVHPWHGDINASKRDKFFKRPAGVLLITPESLEALFVTRGPSLPDLLSGLSYVVIDELHAFIGTERGKQLQSLLHRLELLTSRRTARIGLSATLGDMELTRVFLRPNAPDQVTLLVSKDGAKELKMLLKGYVETPIQLSSKSKNDVPVAADGQLTTPVTADQAIAADLFRLLRGSNNLVFPNARARVEIFADRLRSMCEENGIPNEFWPHHGSLAKSIREDAERALKSQERPATAICTTTLELGIDIGAVKSVVQIGAPPSVASLRQRLGRSGRRGEPAILRLYVAEKADGPDLAISDRLRETLVQNIATINLLLRGWYEPPRIRGLHLSTLIQQLLSLIAQFGGVSAKKAWEVLCEDGAFGTVDRTAFVVLLKELGARKVLVQESSGLLLLGELGERLVNHYSFYAAFASQEEFRVVFQGRTLGTLPVDRPLVKDTYIIFAGRRWRVLEVEAKERIIQVEPAPGGMPPKFDGSGGKVHDGVRREMREVYLGRDTPSFLDATAGELLKEARENFQKLGLHKSATVSWHDATYITPWRGDWAQDTVALLLTQRGVSAVNEGVAIRVPDCLHETVMDHIADLAESPIPDAREIAAKVENKIVEKWDWLLPSQLLDANYASSQLDTEGAVMALRLSVKWDT